MRIIAFCGSPTGLPSLNQVLRISYLSAVFYAGEPGAAWVQSLEKWAGNVDLPCWEVNEEMLEKELAEMLPEIAPDLVIAFDFPFTMPTHLLNDLKFGAWHIRFGFDTAESASVTLQNLTPGKNIEPELHKTISLISATDGGSAVDYLNLLSLALLQNTIKKHDGTSDFDLLGQFKKQ